MNKTWDTIMSFKKADKRHHGVANTLDKDDINTILGTMEFFGAQLNDLKQTYFDLNIARYRVFDWLAMGIQGRIENEASAKVLAHSFIKSNGDVTAFIQDLRETDYEVDTTWSQVELGR